MKELIESCRQTFKDIFLLVGLVLQPIHICHQFRMMMQHWPLRSSWLAIVACLNMDRCPKLCLVDPSPTRNLIQPLTSRSKDPLIHP